MPDYRIRPATLDDIEALVHHRVEMFSEMGTPIDRDVVGRAFREWVSRMLPDGTYRGWVIATPADEIIGGGGITILPWPPGPWYIGGRMAFVYNVYTDPAHRRRGLARMLMEAIHAWCRDAGIGVIGLNASGQAQRLYESMGYRQVPAPMMICGVDPPGTSQ
jgi:GNAT superfamily N-acetyltransferase